MRRRVPILLLATITTLVTTAPAIGGENPGGDPACRIGVDKVGPRAIGFHARCNYEQRQVVIAPGRKLASIVPDLQLSGRVDPEDGFTCGRERSTAVCDGRAGEGARIDGEFRLRKAACKASVDLLVEGGIDCDGPHICASVGYFSEAADLRPKGC